MSLTRRGSACYGTEQRDIRMELHRYSVKNGYPAEHYADAVCTCGGTVFRLSLDEAAGAAVRTCARCLLAHSIGDSSDFLDEAELQDCACSCGRDLLEVTAGVSLYADSEDVRWLYLACRCTSCSRIGVYGDWKNEFAGYKALLSRI